MKLLTNLLSRLSKMLKKLSKLQRTLLAAGLGYFIYVTYMQVERYVNSDSKDDDSSVPDEIIETGMLDNLVGNLGLKNEKLLKKERLVDAKKDEYNMYEGSDIGERKARAIADQYNKY